MTTFFKKLFGTPAATSAETQAPIVSAPVPSRELFLEDRHPEEFAAPEPSRTPKRERTILEELLTVDYTSKGHRDGYEIHDLEGLSMQLELLTSDFRLAYDKAIQGIEAEMEPMRKHLTDRVEEETPDLFEKISLRYQQLRKQKEDIIHQKDLALTGEGYIEQPYRYYKAGFRRGYDLYVEEQLIFKHIKTL